MSSTQLFILSLVAIGLATLVALTWIAAKYGKRP